MKKTKKAIYGALIGDFFGSYWEMAKNKPASMSSWDLFPTGFVVGCYTDDTKMTVAIAKAVMESEKSGLGLDECATKSMRAIGTAIGGGYGGMFLRWLNSKNPKPYGSYGNGACMRVSPVALAAKTRDEAIRMSDAVTAVTHDSEEAMSYSRIVARMVFAAKSASSMREMWKELEDACEGERLKTNEEVMNMSLESLHSEYRFDVSCHGSVPQALYCFLSSDSLFDCVKRCIYIGGDTDTIGAIACSIAAPYYGDKQVETVIEQLPTLPRILQETVDEFMSRYSKRAS